MKKSYIQNKNKHVIFLMLYREAGNILGGGTLFGRIPFEQHFCYTGSSLSPVFPQCSGGGPHLPQSKWGKPCPALVGIMIIIGILILTLTLSCFRHPLKVSFSLWGGSLLFFSAPLGLFHLCKGASDADMQKSVNK